MSDVMVYVQHLLGIGHVRRMALINQAMRDQGLTVTVASGGIPDPSLDFAADRVVQLPACRSADSNFSGLVDVNDTPVDDDWKERRKDDLLAAFKETAPKVLLIEMFPFGRRAFRFELIPLMTAAKQAGVPIVCSVRDLLVRKTDPAKTKWMRDIAREYFDRVLVHGDQNLFGFDHSFPYADDIKDLIVYTGYVAPSPPKAASNTDHGATRNGVLVSAGGGAVGAGLIDLAIAAHGHSEKYQDAPWDIVTGPHFPQDRFDALVNTMPPGITLHRFLPDFRARMAKAAVSVSQAGYNTLMDVLSTQTPAVMVPFAEGGESEQKERGEILANAGVISLLDLDGLTAQSLAKQIDRAKPPQQLNVALNGAQKTASLIAALAKGTA